MAWRATLLFAAALLIGAAIGLYDHARLSFWLMFGAGFLGAWGCCPFSQPLLQRHKDLHQRQSAGQPPDLS